MRRETRKPVRYDNDVDNGTNLIAFAFTMDYELVDSEPRSYKDAISCSDSKKWVEFMEDEIILLKKNET